jgi:LAO/AO transport system kinase
MLMLGHIAGSAPKVGGHSAAASLAAAERAPNDDGWEVPVVSCVATADRGVAELVERFEAHQRGLATPRGQARRRERLEQELLARVREALSATWLERHRAALDEVAERVTRGELDPYAATQILVAGEPVGESTNPS